MQTADFINEFRKKLDTEATSKGFRRLLNGQIDPKDVHGFYGGYAFKHVLLNYTITHDSLDIYLNYDAPESELIAGMRHAINPNVSVEEHESRLQKQASFFWNENEQIWYISSKFYDTDLSGLSTLDTDTLVNYCIKSLANYK